MCWHPCWVPCYGYLWLDECDSLPSHSKFSPLTLDKRGKLMVTIVWRLIVCSISLDKRDKLMCWQQLLIYVRNVLILFAKMLVNGSEYSIQDSKFKCLYPASSTVPSSTLTNNLSWQITTQEIAFLWFDVLRLLVCLHYSSGSIQLKLLKLEFLLLMISFIDDRYIGFSYEISLLQKLAIAKTKVC